MNKSRLVRVDTKQLISLKQLIGKKVENVTGIMPSDRELIYIALKQYIVADEEIDISTKNKKLIIR